MSVPDVTASARDVALAVPSLNIDMLITGLSGMAPLLATAIPLGVYNFLEAMSNVESAAAAGDSYNLRSILLADGTGAIVGSALGSPFPPAVYIGHPGWKEAGGRASYSMASGLLIAAFCFLGLFGFLSTILPLPAIVPILLYIGLLIGAQAFQSTPRLHAAAVVAAIIPNLAAWGAGLIDNALSAAGTSAAKLGEQALGNAGLVYHGLHVLGQGAVLAGIVLGAIVTFILEKQLMRAAIGAAAGAVLSWVGLLHADQVGWAAAPGVALGYAMLGVVLVGIGLVQGPRKSAPEIVDIQQDPVPTSGDVAAV
jgi:AGZA family xanthine/uracil permease-like MFS transporter